MMIRARKEVINSPFRCMFFKLYDIEGGKPFFEGDIKEGDIRGVKKIQVKDNHSAFSIVPRAEMNAAYEAAEKIVAELRIREEIKRVFRVNTKEAAGVIHVYEPGSYIGPHTDYGDGTFRVILNLPICGGSPSAIWALSASSRLGHPRLLIPNNERVLFGFNPTPTSFHALSEVREGFGLAYVMALPIIELDDAA
jgi:hypothetical protein